MKGLHEVNKITHSEIFGILRSTSLRLDKYTNHFPVDQLKGMSLVKQFLDTILEDSCHDTTLALLLLTLNETIAEVLKEKLK